MSGDSGLYERNSEEAIILEAALAQDLVIVNLWDPKRGTHLITCQTGEAEPELTTN